jgi:hypothetical protein
MKSKITFLTTLLSLGWYIVSATNLGVGDLAITSFNADGDDEFSFVLLADISGTTTVYFTENGWDDDANGGGAAPTWGGTTEGTVIWTYVGSLVAGTEIQISDPGGIISASLGTATLSGSSWSISTLRDAIIAYTGSGVPNNGSEVTNFIWAFHEGTNGFINDATGSLESSVPTGLTNGVNAIDFNDGTPENFQYNCSVLTPVSALRTALATEASFTTSGSTNYTAPGCAYLTSPSTTWNGTTWDNGIPNSSTDAVIAGNVAPGTFTCNDLTINSGFALVFGSGQTVTIKGSTVTNNGFGAVSVDATANLIFDNDGNSIDLVGNNHNFRGLVTVSGTTTLNTNGDLVLTAPSASSYGQLNGTGTINGDVSVQAFLNTNPGRYYYLGAPMTDATLSDFNESGATMVSASSSQGTAWEWDAANAEWDPAGTAAGTGLAATAVRGQGYSMYGGMSGSYGPFLLDDGDGTGTITLTGTTDNTSTVGIALSYNDGQAASVGFASGGTVNDTEGWNLVANPYAAIYDWDGQSIPGSMSSAIYRTNGTNYSAYVKGAGTASRYIAPFQGFFVQMTDNVAATLTFDRGNRAPTASATLTKTSNFTLDGVSLHLQNTVDSNVYDDLYVGFDASATASFDLDWDARKLSNKGIAPNMSTRYNGQTYSVSRVDYSGPKAYPIYIEDVVDGTTMELAADLSELKGFAGATLEDRKTGTFHDFANGAYAFVFDATQAPDRFVLHFGNSTISLREGSEAQAYAYTKDGVAVVELGSLPMANIEVYNLAGQRVLERRGAVGQTRLYLPAKGMYLVKVDTGSKQQVLKIVH